MGVIMMNLKFKKVMSVFLAFALIFTFSTPVFAANGANDREVRADISDEPLTRFESLSTGAPLFDPGCPYFDPARIDTLLLERAIAEENQEAINHFIERAITEGNQVMVDHLLEYATIESSVRSSIPVWDTLMNRFALRQQETRWWCGPASAQMALEARRGQIVSQRTFAQEFGNVNSGGTYIIDMQNSLSRRSVQYLHMRADQMNLHDFENKMVEAIHLWRIIPILQVRTGGLSWYQGRSDVAHYVVVGRYENFRGQGNARLVIDDPHWDSRFFGTWFDIPVSEARNAINRHNGHFLA